jgi:Outer membrane protein beta-barrel domain
LSFLVWHVTCLYLAASNDKAFEFQIEGSDANLSQSIVMGKHRTRAMQRTAIIILAAVFLLSVGATAQETRSEISVQGTGFFTKDSNGQGILQQNTQSGGVLGAYRFHINRWLSAEAAYGWNRNSQLFSTPGGFSRIQADVHQATGSLVVNLPTPRRLLNMSPYVLAGGGALIFNPTDNAAGVPGAQRQAVPAFVYGGGADFPIPLVRRAALRLEYRGLVYNAPNFGLKSLDTNTVTHTAEPSAGLVFRF